MLEKIKQNPLNKCSMKNRRKKNVKYLQRIIRNRVIFVLHLIFFSPIFSSHISHRKHHTKKKIQLSKSIDYNFFPFILSFIIIIYSHNETGKISIFFSLFLFYNLFFITILHFFTSSRFFSISMAFLCRYALH